MGALLAACHPLCARTPCRTHILLTHFLAWRTDVAYTPGSRCSQGACHVSPSHLFPSHVSSTVFAVPAPVTSTLRSCLHLPCRTVPDPKARVKRTSACASSLATWPIRRTPHPLCCLCSAATVSTLCDVRMVRSDTLAETLRQEVPGMACSVWTATSRVAVSGLQDAVVPQQRHVPRLQQAEGREARRVHSTSGHRLRLGGHNRAEVPMELLRALRTSRKGQPRLLHWLGSSRCRQEHRRCPQIAFEFWKARCGRRRVRTKQAQPLGQKMDQARARFRRAVESGEKATEALQKGRATSEQAQQEVVAQTDLDKFMQEAPLPVVPVPQVDVSLVETLESLTGIVEKHVEPRRRATTRSLDTGNPRSLSWEAGAALDAEQDLDLWNLDEDEAEQMADFEEAHAPGGPRVESTRARKAAVEPTPMTPPPKKTRTTEPWAAGQEGAQASAELLALSQRACALIPALPFSENSAQHADASLLGSGLCHTLGDTGQLASTRRVGTQARDRRPPWTNSRLLTYLPEKYLKNYTLVQEVWQHHRGVREEKELRKWE